MKFTTVSYIFILLFVCMICGCSTNGEVNYNDLISHKQSHITKFYFDNKKSLNKIKDSLEKENLDIRTINEDGYIELRNSKVIWLDEISEDIKRIYDSESKNGLRSIEYNSDDLGEFYLEYYLPEIQMVIELKYSKQNLATVSDRYTCIDTDWYLWTAGMT